MSSQPAPLSGAAIFSLIAGKVWVSLPGQTRAFDLGDKETVTYMMRDFLAQCAVGDRMTAERQANP